MKDLKKYIEDRSIPIPFAGCWMWMLSLGSHGYGNAHKSSLPGERVVVAHRLSYEAFKGEIPSGMLVQHSCDNKWCVNPHHLSIGTDQTNATDKQLKGRAARKLTEVDVIQINKRIRMGHVMLTIARDFGIDSSLVAAIRNGRVWSHVERKAG